MAIPKYDEFYGHFLKAIKDGQIHEIKEIKLIVGQMIGISDEEKAVLLPSGKMTVFSNRVAWAGTYLKKAGLVDTVGRGKYMITEAGKSVLSQADSIDNTFLMQYESFRTFINREQAETSETQTETNMSPEELLEASFNTINESLADDLMKEVMKLTPSEFEHLVVKLLVKMGYGSGIEEDAFVTPASGDGGIDGVIKEDRLGFSSIYIQAKQWSPDRTVDRPAIDTFIGALTRNHANKGLFITTASFTSGAKTAADATNIVLVDGKHLVMLMIRYNLGVSVDHTYEVKKIDSDFFSDGI